MQVAAGPGGAGAGLPRRSPERIPARLGKRQDVL